jgi:hypothetical protein
MIPMNVLKSVSPQIHWLLTIALASIFLCDGLGKFPIGEGMAQIMGMPVFLV